MMPDAKKKIAKDAWLMKEKEAQAARKQAEQEEARAAMKKARRTRMN